MYGNWMYALVGALMTFVSGGKRWKSLGPDTDATFVSDLQYGRDNLAMPILLYANETADGSCNFFYEQQDLNYVQADGQTRSFRPDRSDGGVGRRHG